MKGILKKTEQGWFVVFDQRTMQDPSAEDGILPLHPEYQTILPLDLDLDGNEVEFEINKYDGKSHISNAWNGYAKLIDSSNRTCDYTNCREVCPECRPYPISDDCEEVKNWDSFAEQKNLELLAEINYPMCEWAEEQCVVRRLAFINGYNKAKESYEVTSSVRELHQYKLGLDDGYNKAKETLYTEEQLREAMDDACIKGFNNNLGLRFNHLYRKDYIDRYIQSLKQK